MAMCINLWKSLWIAFACSGKPLNQRALLAPSLFSAQYNAVSRKYQSNQSLANV